jgi:hypothetical protein
MKVPPKVKKKKETMGIYVPYSLHGSLGKFIKCFSCKTLQFLFISYNLNGNDIMTHVRIEKNL